jgi:hypothetical protein
MNLNFITRYLGFFYSRAMNCFLTIYSRFVCANVFSRRNVLGLLLVYFVIKVVLVILSDSFFFSFLMLAGDEETSEGIFIPQKGGTREVPCSLMHQVYPEVENFPTAITQPREVAPGVFERFVKINKEVADYDSLSIKNKAGYLASSSEPRCLRSLGSFFKYASNVIVKK